MSEGPISRPEVVQPKPSPEASSKDVPNSTRLNIPKAEAATSQGDRNEVSALRALLRKMKPGKKEQTIDKVKKRADAVVAKKDLLLKNPMARTNLGLTAVGVRYEHDDKGKLIYDEQGNKIPIPVSIKNLNPDWQPTPESGLKPFEQTTTSETLKRELKTGVKVKDPETGQEFNVLKTNWKKFEAMPDGSKRVLVFLPGYNNAIESGGTNYRLEEVSSQIDVPVLAIDHPGMGKSDKLTKVQKETLRKEKSYRSIAEAELRMMKAMGITDIDLMGQSMGAWAAAEIARNCAAAGITVHNLFLDDPPGVKQMSPKELTQRTLAESQYYGLYINSTFDPEMVVKSGFDKSEIGIKKDQIPWALSTLKNDPDRLLTNPLSRGVYKASMAEQTLEATLEDALAKNSELTVANAFGTISGVSPVKENREMIANLQAKFDTVDKEGKLINRRVRTLEFPGEPHTVLEHAKRNASIAKYVLTGSPI